MVIEKMKIKKNQIVYMVMLFSSLHICAFTENQRQQTSTVTLNIMPVCHLGIKDANVEQTIDQNSTLDNLEKGGVEFPAGKPTLDISSNQQWKLTVRASQVTGPYNKDISDVMIRDASANHVVNGFSDYQSLSAQDQEIAVGERGVFNEAHPCQYRMLIDWDKDIPGTYSTTVTYTLTTLAS